MRSIPGARRAPGQEGSITAPDCSSPGAVRVLKLLAIFIEIQYYNLAQEREVPMRCRAWYLVPIVWLFGFGGAAIYAVYRQTGWEGWFSWLTANDSPVTGDLLSLLILTTILLVAHCGLRRHIMCAHCSARPSGSGESNGYRRVPFRGPVTYRWEKNRP